MIHASFDVLVAEAAEEGGNQVMRCRPTWANSSNHVPVVRFRETFVVNWSPR